MRGRVIDRRGGWCAIVAIACVLIASSVAAQTVAGTIRDETGGVLPGVTVELRPAAGAPRVAVTDAQGAFRFDRIAPGRYQASFTLINFASRAASRSRSRPPGSCASMRSCICR